MAPRPEYSFTRDYLDNNRINLMHFLWTKVCGYRIHPKIDVSNPDIRVADVGTGTGIWLFDIAQKLPKSAQLYGMDISFDAAPPPETLPSNVSLRRWDVRDDVPDDLVGTMDIVHVRFFAVVLLNEEAPGVVSKLFQLLKPGGFLQWGEPDLQSIRIERSKLDNRTENIESLNKIMSAAGPGFKPVWVTDLPTTFSAAGFVDVERDLVDEEPHLGFALHECGLMIHKLIARKTKNEEMVQKLETLLPAAVEETREGAYTTADRWTVVGRKPVD